MSSTNKYEISLGKSVRILDLDKSVDKFDIVIDAEKGCWARVNEEDIPIVRLLLSKPIYIDEFMQTFPNKVSVIRDLFHSGLLCIDGLSRYSNNTVDTCKCIEKEQLIIVVNMTEKCNLVCSYCYAHSEENRNALFSDEDIVCYIDTVYRNLQSTRYLTIVFHGGEPLMIYHRLKWIIERVRGISSSIRISVQTNGTMLTVEIACFFKDNNVSIGLSLDGTSSISNKNRIFKSGASTVNAVIEGIKILLLVQNDFGVLSVITPQNTPYIVQTFDALIELGVKNFAFNFLLQSESAHSEIKEIDYRQLASAYEDIACRINDINSMRDYKDFVSERSTTTLIRSLLHQEQSICYCTPCGAGTQTIAIDIKGDVYACDCLVGHKEFYMGSIYDDFKVASLSPITILGKRVINMISICRDCPIRQLCINKCASDSFYRYKDVDHPHSLCKFSQILIPKLMNLLTDKRLNPDFFKLS